MVRFYRIILMLTALAALFACNTENDNTIADQRTRIESFLSSYEDDTEQIRGIYRYLANTDREDYAQSTVIEKGDSVEFWFTMYEFRSRRITPAFFTNRAETIEELRKQGLSSVFWSRDPLREKAGSFKNLRFIDPAIPGCRMGDSVSFFLTSNLVYGNKYAGPLEEDTPVEVVIKITDVKNK